MKTKTEAAKILLEKGWTFEEVERVLGREQIVINPAPLPVYPQPIGPWPDRVIEPWRLPQTWCETQGNTPNSITFTVETKTTEPS